MSRADLNAHFSKISELVDEMNTFVPQDDNKKIQFRANLAGLLVVSISATYETCVKETLCEYAHRHHILFGGFADRNYEKINSRIRIDDLRRYCDLFGDSISCKFKATYRKKRERIRRTTGFDIEQRYSQLFSWRNDFAHGGIRNTTIEEVYSSHNIAKRVMYIFNEAFS